ncbi:MAG: hypothetical protein HOG01_01630, partial [Methylococcales bacterium]|nr:hypothetical protein [Methylococcales bacterium]
MFANKVFIFCITGALLWLTITFGFNINIPLLPKESPNANTLKTTLSLPKGFSI